MATMKEIAALAGLSRGTVDRVLNNRGNVSKETIDKVMQVADSLNYAPSRVAKSLAARKHNILLTFLMPDPHLIPFFSQVEEGALHAAQELKESGATVQLQFTSGWDEEEYLEKLNSAVREHSDGIAIAGPDTPRIASRLMQIGKAGIPVITVNTEIRRSGCLAYVGSNAYCAGKTAAGLINLFMRDEIRIGIIFGFANNSCHMERITGLRDGLKELGRQWHECFFLSNQEDEFESYDLVKEACCRQPAVNVLYFATGNGVYGGCRAVEKLKMPQPPKIICHDEQENLRKMFQNKLITATICQEPKRQGEYPLKVLFDYLALGVRPVGEQLYTDANILTCESFLE